MPSWKYPSMPQYATIASAEGPNGLFATLEATRLIIRCAETKLLLRNIDLDPKLVSAVRHLKWYRPPPPPCPIPSSFPAESQSAPSPHSPPSPTSTSSTTNSARERLLLATQEDVHVYEVANQRWTAVVRRICGSSGQKIAHVDFGAHPDEIVAWSTLGLKIALVSLTTGASAELRDPKSPATRCHSLRRGSCHLAVLTRPTTKDVLTVLAPGEGKGKGEVEWGTNLPTVDAQGVRWSPDGTWIAVWDAATAGSALLVYTAGGRLFKRLSGGGGGGADSSSGGTGNGGASSAAGNEDLGYGIQRIDWDPAGRFLAVAANEGKVVLLSTKNAFRPVVALDYPSIISSGHAVIHEEQIATDGSRAYSPAQQPATLPPPAPSAGPKDGATPSSLGFNHLTTANSGDLLACVPASTPTTVWIHSIHPNPQLTAVLIHHGAVRSLAWHPHQHGLLLIHCAGTGAGEDGASSPVLTSERPQSRAQAKPQSRPQSRAQTNHHHHQPKQNQQASRYWTGGTTTTPSTPTAPRSSSAVYLWGYDLPEPIVLPNDNKETITKAVWLQSSLKTQAMISTASSCTLISVLELDSGTSSSSLQHTANTEHADFPTPKAPPSVIPPPANVQTATPAPLLGYYDDGTEGMGMETPLTARGSDQFSPVKMDTAQLTRTLGFQFTSLRDEEDTFEFKQGQGMKQPPVKMRMGAGVGQRKASVGSASTARRGVGGAR